MSSQHAKQNNLLLILDFEAVTSYNETVFYFCLFIIRRQLSIMYLNEES